MITIKRLNTPQMVEHACALLHEVYIEQQKWVFKPDNPSQIRIESAGDRYILVDRFTSRAIWFGAFDDEKLVGCVRLFGLDENDKFEVESYPIGPEIHQFFATKSRSHCYDISKMATKEDYVGKGIVKRLLLACFRFCEENKFSAFAFTHNGYLKSLLKKIEFPMKAQQIFKYEPQDKSAVNFYFADYADCEVNETLKKLEYLESDISNNAKNVFRALQTVETVFPTPFYWMDARGVVLGINDLALKAIGTTRAIIGEKPYSFYKTEIAQHILEHNNEVMRKEEILSQEEWIEDITTKERKCFSSIKAPLYDDEGTIIGIVGTSIEITAHKEAELLRKKNEQLEIESISNNLILAEQNKFKKVVSQMLHDINTPLATLKILLGYCNDIPEKLRTVVRSSLGSVDNITRNLLNQYTLQGELNEKEVDLLLSAALINTLNEKQYQFKDRNIHFDWQFSPESYCAFIRMQPVAFKRTVSNIINNAVDALDQKPGTIIVRLTIEEGCAKIVVEDSGKGMPAELVRKIKQQVAITQDKDGGHGIGLMQVFETLKRHNGHMDIESVQGTGTQIILTFPLMESPEWITNSIHLNPSDTIVILDDDCDIHEAWDIYFESKLFKENEIKIRHFTEAVDAISFVQSMSTAEREHVFLLTDYELLKQDINGLNVIDRLNPIRAILITGHHENIDLQDQAIERQTKIIPKSLVSQIPITVMER